MKKSIQTLIAIALLANMTHLSSAAELKLKQLDCIKTEDWLADGDETALFVYVDGVRFNIYQKDMKKGDKWILNEPIRFKQEVRLELFDLDVPSINDDNDALGEVVISATPTNGNAIFDQDEALYRLSYSVTANNSGPSTQPTPEPQPDYDPNNKPGPSPQKLDGMKKTIEEFLKKHVAKGNERKVEVKKFEYQNGHIVFDIRIHHKHRTNTPFGKQTIYSFTSDTNGYFDPRNPDSIKKCRVCSKLNQYLGGGNICVTFEQIAKLLTLV